MFCIQHYCSALFSCTEIFFGNLLFMKDMGVLNKQKCLLIMYMVYIHTFKKSDLYSRETKNLNKFYCFKNLNVT